MCYYKTYSLPSAVQVAAMLQARASANKATQAAAAARPAVPAATERRLGDQPQAAQQAAPAGRLPPPASAPPVSNFLTPP